MSPSTFQKVRSAQGESDVTANGSFVRAVGAVHFAVADLVRRQADGGVVGAMVLGRLAGRRLARLLIRAVLAVDVAIAHPALRDALACQPRSTRYVTISIIDRSSIVYSGSST